MKEARNNRRHLLSLQAGVVHLLKNLDILRRPFRAVQFARRYFEESSPYLSSRTLPAPPDACLADLGMK